MCPFIRLLAIRPLAIAALALLVIASTQATSARTVDGVVRGEVTDASGGVLPGVTVAATSADGQILSKAVTDDVGRYVLRSLPAGPVTLVFELDGFDTGRVSVVVQPVGESWMVERLRLARMTEEIVVYGKVPVDPPAIPMRGLSPPPRTVIPVPAQELESVCGPAKPDLTAESLGTIQSHRYEHQRTLYTTGDELIIDGGTRNGLAIGRNLVVRRYYRANSAGETADTGEHTAGLVQIVAANERVSTAVVVYACNELMEGDRLASFTPEPMRAPGPIGAPVYADAARVLFADAGQMLGAPRRLLVIDHGSEQGIYAGQRLTLFRRSGSSARPLVLGLAVVVSVRADSATIRVESAIDAIWFGDWAAPQRPG